MNGMVCGILAAFVVSYMYGNPYLGVINLWPVATMMIVFCWLCHPSGP